MEVLGAALFIGLIILCMAEMSGLSLFLIRLSAPHGVSPRRGRHRRRRRNEVEAAIARLDAVQIRRGRNVFFWPW